MKRLNIMILTLLLTGCMRGSIRATTNVCPDIVEYTKEEQREMIKIINDNNNNIVLNRFIIDYYNLREKIRVCKMGK